MPVIVERILDSRVFCLLARVLFCFPFWASGLAKLIDFRGGMSEMAHFGLEPAILFNGLTIMTELAGSALIIANSRPWLGAGALAIFTLLTIPIAHDFWDMTDPQRTTEFYVAMEHTGYVGGLMLAAVLGHVTRREATAGRSAQEAYNVG